MRAIEEAVPHLVRLFSIGTSYEGRPILLAEVTNRGTREGLEKPALWLDGNLHAPEVAGTAATLELLRQLAAGHGRDEFITYLLDHCTFYIAPRLSPDGAEHCLTTGDVLRSGTRPYPHEDPIPGLVPADLDGDGWILQMRVEDALGEWKVSKRDPRLLIRRQPDDREGPFYRLYREGYLETAAGKPVHVPEKRFGLDFNRNFPFDWKSEKEQTGAGPYPLSEPETRAVADFFRTHPNLCCSVSCHTFGGLILRPYSSYPDDRLPPEDLVLYSELGRRAEELTGYKCITGYQGFHRVVRPIRGGMTDWAYDQMGLLSFDMVLWSLGRTVGLEVSDPTRFLKERSEVENLAILRWLDREVSGRGFTPWKPFPHPQLGPVEIGGWNQMITFFNPPPGQFLREETEKYARFVLGLAAACPRLVVRRLEEEVLGWTSASRRKEPAVAEPFLSPKGLAPVASAPDTADGGAARPLRKVVLELENEGYLPTWVTWRALDLGVVQQTEVYIEADEGTDVVLGDRLAPVGHLAGTGTVHCRHRTDAIWFQGGSEDQRRRLEWLVRGEGEVRIEIRHDRGGTLTVSSRIRTEEPSASIPTLPAPPVRPSAPAPPPMASAARSSRQQPPVPSATPPPAAGPVIAPAPPATVPKPPPSAPRTPQPAAEPRKPATPGRVLGAPPSRPGPTPRPMTPQQEAEMAAARPEPAYQAGEPSQGIKPLNPLPLVKGGEFEPRSPVGSHAAQRTGGLRPAEPPPSAVPPDSDFPEAPPRASRIPAPLLLRRQRGKDKNR
ncbi:MAG: hypothetical protein HY319_28760 [Armatimonadetes bacterium]|nr:hypothetical protein [Armatimonadota bacterium]